MEVATLSLLVLRLLPVREEARVKLRSLPCERERLKLVLLREEAMVYY